MYCLLNHLYDSVIKSRPQRAINFRVYVYVVCMLYITMVSYKQWDDCKSEQRSPGWCALQLRLGAFSSWLISLLLLPPICCEAQSYQFNIDHAWGLLWRVWRGGASPSVARFTPVEPRNFASFLHAVRIFHTVDIWLLYNVAGASLVTEQLSLGLNA